MGIVQILRLNSRSQHFEGVVCSRRQRLLDAGDSVGCSVQRHCFIDEGVSPRSRNKTSAARSASITSFRMTLPLNMRRIAVHVCANAQIIAFGVRCSICCGTGTPTP
jgi:hypothetical protein